MKRALQILAAVTAVTVVALWSARGESTAWTKTKVQVWTLDEITEIKTPEWRERFVPGLDFLGGGLFVAGALVVASRFTRTNNKPITNKQNQA